MPAHTKHTIYRNATTTAIVKKYQSKCDDNSNSKNICMEKRERQSQSLKKAQNPLLSVSCCSSAIRIWTTVSSSLSCCGSFGNVIKHPGSCTHNTNPPLFGTIHKTVSRIGMETSNIDIVFFGQHGRYLAHIVLGVVALLVMTRELVAAATTTTNTINGRHGMIGFTILDGFSYSIPNQAEIGGWGKFDARHGRGLPAIQGTGIQQLSQSWPISHRYCR